MIHFGNNHCFFFVFRHQGHIQEFTKGEPKGLRDGSPQRGLYGQNNYSNPREHKQSRDKNWLTVTGGHAPSGYAPVCHCHCRMNKDIQYAAGNSFQSQRWTVIRQTTSRSKVFDRTTRWDLIWVDMISLWRIVRDNLYSSSFSDYCVDLLVPCIEYFLLSDTVFLLICVSTVMTCLLLYYRILQQSGILVRCILFCFVAFRRIYMYVCFSFLCYH